MDNFAFLPNNTEIKSILYEYLWRAEFHKQIMVATMPNGNYISRSLVHKKGWP
jgi:hypothetical protein